MAQFLTDADVPQPLGVRLIAAGHDVLRAFDAGLTRTSDDAVLLAAVNHGRILITCNGQDFLVLHRAWLRWPSAWGMSSSPPHTGILSLPPVPRADYPPVAQAIGRLVSGRSFLANELHAWHGSGWVQH